jgi:hypothetical protein
MDAELNNSASAAINGDRKIAKKGTKYQWQLE